MDDVVVFKEFFALIDESLSAVFTTAAAGLITWVVPIAWTTLGTLMLIWSYYISKGKGDSISDAAQKLFVAVLIIHASSTLYVTYVALPLIGLPEEISNRVAGGTSATTTLDQLTGSLIHIILGVLMAGVEAFKTLNFGGALVLFLAAVMMLIAGALLLIAVVTNMIYAKIGISYLLAVGPMYVFFLMVPPIKNWFFSWLNSIMYFVMLTVFSTMTMLLFVGIANKFMQKLAASFQAQHEAKLSFAESVFAYLKGTITGEGGDGGAVTDAGTAWAQAEWSIISVAFQMVLIFIPLFLVALETRTMVASLTGGSGGSFGSGVVNVISTAWRGGFARHK